MSKKEGFYKVFDSFCLRTPLFSFNKYQHYLSRINKDLKNFNEILKDVTFREAIFLASPALYNEIEKGEKGGVLNPDKIEKTQLSVLKYFTRMATRCTPFGLFASCSNGSFESETAINLEKSENYNRFTRFDTTFLTQLFHELLKRPNIKEQVLWSPNNSIYKIDSHYRYVEYTIENKKRSYSLEGFLHSKYIERILLSSEKGATITELSQTLISNEITANEARFFVEELIENQILVSELEITVTGQDYFKGLLSKIQGLSETSEIYKQLLVFQKQMNQLDAVVGNDINSYQSLIKSIKTIVPTLDTKYLFQTDVFTSLKKSSLQKSVKKQLKKALIVFNKMTLPAANSSVEEFKQRFLNRFEQSEIPLSLVLDIETGIGFGDKKADINSLVDDLSLFESKKRYERIIWTDVDTVLHKKLVIATQNNSKTIELTEEDFKELPTNWDDLPDTFSSIIEVYNSGNEEQIFMKEIGGSSATYLLGRFAYGDKFLEKQINEIVQIEKTINEGKILAEIVHLPEARTGNVLQRPSFRNYEIPYLGKSNVVSQNQIPIADIMVSVKNDTIVLRSKKLNKEILPRLGNAHNYSGNTIPVYHFLCAIQAQNKRSNIGFNWNSIYTHQTFLPRVTFENVIFAKTRWNIEVKTFKEVFNNSPLLPAIKSWQEKNSIPNWVELVDGDNKLLINLTSEISIKMLFNTIKNNTFFRLEEFLFTEDEVVKNEENDSFCNQFVVSFYNEEKFKNHQK